MPWLPGLSDSLSFGSALRRDSQSGAPTVEKIALQTFESDIAFLIQSSIAELLVSHYRRKGVSFLPITSSKACKKRGHSQCFERHDRVTIYQSFESICLRLFHQFLAISLTPEGVRRRNPEEASFNFSVAA